MSIIEQLANSSPHSLSAMCTREQFLVTSIGEGGSATNVVDPSTCQKPLIVFAHETDELKNDYTSLFRKKKGILGTVEFWLLDEDCQEVVQFTDDTFGTYYAEGTWTSNSGQELQSGFKVDWWLVYNTYGGGLYKLKIVQPSLIVGGDDIEITSCPFLLTAWDAKLAHDTVRMEVEFNSYYVNSGEDFRGINWQQMYRIPGSFGVPQPKVEKDNYLNTDRDISDIQDKMYNEYTLETYQIPYCFTSEMMPTNENKSLASIADQIFLTSYNLYDHFTLERVPVVLKEISIPDQTPNSNKVSMEMTFEDRNRRNVKRSVR